MKRLYLAARFTDRPQMETAANRLKSLGYEITARWVYGGEDGLTREHIAIMDIEDVDACDTLVSFTQPYGSVNKGGGRHVEFGYAMARRKRLVVIGERENVFHHHPDVEIYPTFDAWLHHLNVSEPA
jgi:nucleoside 2-deoxyribosyltransferase